MRSDCSLHAIALFAAAQVACSSGFEAGDPSATGGPVVGSGPSTASVGGNGAGGNGGSATVGGSGGAARPSCEGLLPPHGSAIFHSTLDSAGALANPAIGDGTGVTAAGAPAFVSAIFATGAAFTQQTASIGWLQISNGTNFKTESGTLDFCFKPSFASAVDQDHILFYAETESGFFTVRKAAALNQLELQVIASASTSTTETTFPPANFSFVPGTWYRLTVAWDFSPGDSQRQVRLYVDGIEIVPGPVAGMGAFAIAPEMPTQRFYLGGGGSGRPSALGVFDELVIYPDPTPP